MLDYSINSQDIFNMPDFKMGIIHAKFLNYLKKKGKEIERKLISFYSNGKTHHGSYKEKYLNDLKNEKAIIEEDKKIYLTAKGEELLNNNQHLLKRFSANPDKTRCDKGIPTTEDMAIMEHVKNLIANNKISELKTTIIAKKLGITHQLVSRRLKRLKDAGHIYYIPRRMDSIRIIKDIK